MLESVWFRSMVAEDLEQVCAIEKETFSMPWSKEAFLQSLKLTDTFYYVAENSYTKEIFGYCGLYQSFSEAYITNVAVKKQARNQHIASGMLTAFMEEGQRRGIRAYTLEVREGNQAAIRLYANLGFESMGIRKNFYENPKDNAVIMWKT